MERYQGKKVVIIGGTSGIGLATAKMLMDDRGHAPSAPCSGISKGHRSGSSPRNWASRVARWGVPWPRSRPSATPRPHPCPTHAGNICVSSSRWIC